MAPRLLQINPVESVAPTYQAGRMFWRGGTLNVYSEFDGVTPNVTREEFVLVRNETGATLPNGTVVYIVSSSGGVPTVAKADASDPVKAVVKGVLTMDIANNANGLCTNFGLINDLNTSGFTAGAQIYLSATTPGALTATPPLLPALTVIVAVCTVSHATTGQILVTPTTVIDTPFGAFTMEDNVTDTVFGGVSTFVKVLGTTTAGVLARFTHTNNRLTYTGQFTRYFRILTLFDVYASGVSKNFRFGLYKNGVLASSRTKLRTTGGTDPIHGSCIGLISMATNDYMELWAANDTNTNPLVVQDLQMGVQ